MRPAIRCLSISIALSFALAAFAHAQSFTLEQVTSSPFPSDLIVSQRGDKLAWAFDADGKRTIGIAEAPAYAARQLTHYDKDDGGELTDLALSPNGNFIAFARGNEQGKNQAGEYANPTSDQPAQRKRFGSLTRAPVGRR